MRRDEPFAVGEKVLIVDHSRGVFPEMQRRMETHVHSVCSRGRGSRSLRDRRRCHGNVSAARAIQRTEPTRKQLLARLDLRVRLNANDDLPTRPSVVLPNLTGAGDLAGAVRSARCPER